MKKTRATVTLAAIFAASFTLTAITVVRANNQWSCWHWNKNTIGASSVAGGYWGTINGSELNQWASGTCVNFNGGSEITVDADFYGGTGWLGLARLLQYNTSTCEILQAEALMNQSYLDGASYDETDDRHVACQEIGHTIGLDHRKGPNNQTCMNDSFLGFPDFDAHDAGVVNAITGGCGGGGCGAAGAACSSGTDCCSGVCKRNGTCR